MANGGSYPRLTRKAEGFEFSENSPAKLDASARARSPTSDVSLYRSAMDFDRQIYQKAHYWTKKRNYFSADTSRQDYTVISPPGGADGVMVIVVGNGHGDTNSNPGRG